ncbi:MAG: SdpI family protein [Flavobacteriales bacterium]
MDNVLWMFGIIFTLFGVLLIFFPPKKINGIYGYKTASSMKNIEAWHLGQQLGGRGLLLIGLCELGFAGLSLTFNHFMINNPIYGIGILIVGIIFTFIYTEGRLKAL